MVIEPPPQIPPTPAPDTSPPSIPAPVPLSTVIPVGWELSTQQIRPIKAAPAPTAGGIKPTAPVMSATVATMFAPIVAAAATAAGHPIPNEILLTLPTLFAFIGGWLHGDGRS